ncbi:hypothetical protein O6H91_14G059000 [Diphasiastrum complanatum]|uniref:Uncharacterized protein n=1 Tax=Diphasiastrum complanatum TaxID=34168 RepID=A0ACC2BQ15_DIPCM|nr:hypothetical protein O6H91_14G059000 [Diphasiastrum complanatum]
MDDEISLEFQRLLQEIDLFTQTQEPPDDPVEDEKPLSSSLAEQHLMNPIWCQYNHDVKVDGVLYAGAEWTWFQELPIPYREPPAESSSCAAAVDIAAQQAYNLHMMQSLSRNPAIGYVANREDPVSQKIVRERMRKAQSYELKVTSSLLSESAGKKGFCKYFSRGYCKNGDHCNFLHNPHDNSATGNCRMQTKSVLSTYGDSSKFDPYESQLRRYSRNSAENLASSSSTYVLPFVEQNNRYEKLHLYGNSIMELAGKINFMARDQNGCRFLQKKCDEVCPEDVHIIFLEVREQITELVSHRFGNYLIQKLLEVCNEEDRKAILHAVTQSSDIIPIALNLHGTRSVQKLIQTLDHTSSQQVSMLTKALKQGVVDLIKDTNGNHVIQRCLEHLSNVDNQFIYDAASVHCVEIATHSQGCCILQRCLDSASPSQQKDLVSRISLNALALSEDLYGNYVIQHVITKFDAASEITARLKGHFVYLAKLKSGSNVVETCLKFATINNRAAIVKEFLMKNVLKELLRHQFGNYVVKCAYKETGGALHYRLYREIHRLYPEICNDDYGRRALDGMNWKHTTSPQKYPANHL